MSFSNACEFVNTVYGNEKNGKKKGEDMRKIDFNNLKVRKKV